MTRQLTFLCLHIVILSTLLQTCHIHCFQRLLRRKLTSDEMLSNKNSDDIRSIISASLTGNEPSSTGNNNKRDTSSDERASLDSTNDDNIAVESKDSSIYDDDTDELVESDGIQQNRQIDDYEYKKRSPVESDSSSAIDEHAEKIVDQADFVVDDESDSKEVKDVVKREARNENDYDEDDFEGNSDGDSSIAGDRKNIDVVARSTLDEINPEDYRKNENPRDTDALMTADSDLDYQRQIEDQIQERIDSIKDDIKREIERKQRVREIEANNAKYDELEFHREDDEVVDDEATGESSKRSISRDSNESNDRSDGNIATRTKRRSDLENLDEVKSDDNNGASVGLPVKKRSFARHVTLVEKRETRNPRKRKDRNTILIPEQGHAEVKDDLPSDLTLDPNLRIARSYDKAPRSSENSRSSRSTLRQEENPSGRYRRDMTRDFDNEKSLDEIDETPEESNNFLFAPAREKTQLRNRRRRSRAGRDRARSIDRGKSHKHPRHSRRHRATRESSMDEEELENGERNKRAMSIDENAALEYKESFGGFPSESGGALGRFKRIRRSVRIS